MRPIGKILLVLPMGLVASCGAGAIVGDVGSPLILADITTARRGAASCVIRDTDSIDKKFVFGGVNGTGVLNTSYLYDPATDSWTAKSTTYPSGMMTLNMPALVNAKMIAIPGTDQCLLTGGTTSDITDTNNPTTASGDTFTYDLSANAWAKVATASPLSNRRFFELAVCGTGTGANARIIAVGGEGWNGAIQFRGVDVYNAGTPAWSSLTALGTARSKLSLSVKPDGTLDQFMIAGGRSAIGTRLNSVELLQVTSTCTLTSRVNGDATIGTRQDAALFPEGTADTFNITGGDNAGALSTTDKILVVNWTTGDITVTTGANALTTARERLQVVQYSPTKYAVVGGINTTPAVENAVQVWDTVTKSWRGEVDLFTARFGFTAEYLPSEERAVVSGGASATDGTGYLDDVESL